MAAPVGLAFSQAGANASGSTGWLAVSDNADNRVLLFQRPVFQRYECHGGSRTTQFQLDGS